MILIRSKGATQLVESLDGYPRARVIARDVEPPPHDHCKWKGGKWVEDAAAKAAADERARLATMSRAELVQHLVETANLRGPVRMVKPARQQRRIGMQQEPEEKPEDEKPEDDEGKKPAPSPQGGGTGNPPPKP